MHTAQASPIIQYDREQLFHHNQPSMGNLHGQDHLFRSLESGDEEGHKGRGPESCQAEETWEVVSKPSSLPVTLNLLKNPFDLFFISQTKYLGHSYISWKYLVLWQLHLWTFCSVVFAKSHRIWKSVQSNYEHITEASYWFPYKNLNLTYMMQIYLIRVLIDFLDGNGKWSWVKPHYI